MNAAITENAWHREIAIVCEQMQGSRWEKHLEKGRRIALAGQVRQSPDEAGMWLVPGDHGTYRVSAIANHCTCDYRKFHHDPCSHAVALQIYTRCLAGGAQPPQEKKAMETFAGTPVVRVWPKEEPQATPAPRPQLNPNHIVDIQGKPCITFAGLLDYAHALGLQSLCLETLEISAERAIFLATATMKSGAVFMDVGDATPANVTGRVKQHFIRVAATRAKARALKNACNIDMVTAEELDEAPEETPRRPVPDMSKPPEAKGLDYEQQISGLLANVGKTKGEIEEYWQATKKKYGKELHQELPRIYHAMKARQAKQAKQPVRAASTDEEPW